MFAFLKKNRARSAVLQVLPVLVDGVQALSPLDRSATYAVAHGLLKVAAETWGKPVYADLDSLSDETAGAIVGHLADSHGKVLDLLKGMGDRGMDDASYSQAMRQLRATECVMAMVGRRWAPRGEAKAVSGAWRILWNARGEAEEAVDVLLRFAKVAKVDAVPRLRSHGSSQRREHLLDLATTLPEFLRKAKPSRKPAVPKADVAATASPRATSGSARPQGSRGGGVAVPKAAPSKAAVPKAAVPKAAVPKGAVPSGKARLPVRAGSVPDDGARRRRTES